MDPLPNQHNHQSHRVDEDLGGGVIEYGYVAPSIHFQTDPSPAILAPQAHASVGLYDVMYDLGRIEDLTVGERNTIRQEALRLREEAVRRIIEAQKKIESGNIHEVNNGRSILNVAKGELDDTAIVLRRIGWT